MSQRASIEEQRDRLRVQQRLQQEGFGQGDLWALKKDPEAVSRAAPVLLDLLEEIESPRVKIPLVEVASSAPILPGPLVAELRRLRPQIESDYRTSDAVAELEGQELIAELDRIKARSTGAASLGFALADALRERADLTVYEDLVDILRDRGFGRARQMVPYALANAKLKSRREDTIRVLLEVLDDEDITPHVLDVLPKLEAVEAIPAIRTYLDSPVPLVKSNAAKALKKLGKVQNSASGGTRPESSSPQPLPPPPADLAEASTNFDLEQVPVFLKHLVSLVEGLGDSEVSRIESRLFEMEPDEEAAFDLAVRYRGEETRLHIRMYMSDIGAPDVGFFTSADLAEAIDQLMDDLE